jgi:hypothetical protein
MTRTRFYLAQFGSLAILGCLPIGLTDAAEVAVVTERGRELTAELDVRTDEESLWLRYVSPSIVLRQAVAWENVAAARIGSEEIPVDQLKQQVAELATELPADHFDKAEQPHDMYIPPPKRRRVRSVHAWAEPASWDQDAETDGLLLHIEVLGEDG